VRWQNCGWSGVEEDLVEDACRLSGCGNLSAALIDRLRSLIHHLRPPPAGRRVIHTAFGYSHVARIICLSPPTTSGTTTNGSTSVAEIAPPTCNSRRLYVDPAPQFTLRAPCHTGFFSSNTQLSPPPDYRASCYGHDVLIIGAVPGGCVGWHAEFHWIQVEMDKACNPHHPAQSRRSPTLDGYCVGIGMDARVPECVGRDASICTVGSGEPGKSLRLTQAQTESKLYSRMGHSKSIDCLLPVRWSFYSTNSYTLWYRRQRLCRSP